MNVSLSLKWGREIKSYLDQTQLLPIGITDAAWPYEWMKCSFDLLAKKITLERTVTKSSHGFMSLLAWAHRLSDAHQAASAGHWSVSSTEVLMSLRCKDVPQILLFPLSPYSAPNSAQKMSLCFFLSPWESLSALFLVLTFFSWLSLSDWLLTLTSKFLLIFFTCFLERSYVFFFLKIGYQNTCTKARRWGFKTLFLCAIFPHQMTVYFPNISLIYLF